MNSYMYGDVEKLLAQLISGMELLNPPIFNLQNHFFFCGEEGLFSTLQSLSYRCNTASLLLFYHYFHGKYSDISHSLGPPVQTWKTRRCYGVESVSFPFCSKC